MNTDNKKANAYDGIDTEYLGKLPDVDKKASKPHRIKKIFISVKKFISSVVSKVKRISVPQSAELSVQGVLTALLLGNLVLFNAMFIGGHCGLKILAAILTYISALLCVGIYYMLEKKYPKKQYGSVITVSFSCGFVAVLMVLIMLVLLFDFSVLPGGICDTVKELIIRGTLRASIILAPVLIFRLILEITDYWRALNR